MARRAIHVDGLDHGNVPAAAMAGNILISTPVNASDPASKKTPESAAERFRIIFSKIEAICLAAGGSLDDVIRLTFYLPSRADVKDLNAIWGEVFVDPENVPARYVIIATEPEPPFPIFYADFTAVIG